MRELRKEEMLKIDGGADPILITAIVTGLITFITGILSGQIKLKWQKLKNTVFKGNFVEKPSIQIHQEDAIMYIKL